MPRRCRPAGPAGCTSETWNDRKDQPIQTSYSTIIIAALFALATGCAQTDQGPTQPNVEREEAYTREVGFESITVNFTAR